jgi:hypothetical protein
VGVRNAQKTPYIQIERKLYILISLSLNQNNRSFLDFSAPVCLRNGLQAKKLLVSFW